MPSHRVHRAFSRMILGRAYPEVDRLIDLVGVVGLKGHRRHLHTPLEAAVISTVLTGSPLPGLLHVLLDEAFSRGGRRLQLE